MPIKQRNKKLWCEYHKECGHTTHNCRELKKALNKLAEEGKINRYLKSPLKDKQRSKASKEVQEAQSSADTNMSINVIAGGFASGGLSNRARKGHLRSLEEPVYDVDTPSSTLTDPPMVFGDDNVKKIQRPHDDPLVIHMKVANAKVKKILVDNGSSTDIITWKCIEQMYFGRKDLTPLEKPLAGFGGKHVYPLGTIKLPVRLGEKKKGRSLVHTFLVVDTPLPYNMIIGRPLLNRVKAVISTYHLLLQFETDDGSVGKIYGDQFEGRKCYVESLKQPESSVN
ncbi:uncharacterized protein LOC110704120 [Chenopodium quinoa]|uniref:uncharacterized protein LOC110704120 n=1 Tax=Chenopodium quinoa TaxID=63459 RepID=UPI000B78F772|nr:uncharacterized protein LOC110704120 [Chenopodium quinoa]